MNLSHLIITTALGLTALVPDVDPSCQRHPDDLDHLVYKLAKPDNCEPPGPSRGNGVRRPDPSHEGGRAEELTVSRAWLSLGKALMAGLGCQDRHDCPGKLSCYQVVEQAVRQPPQSRREQRHTHTHDFEGIFSGDLDTYPITDPQGQKRPETSQHSHNLRKRSPQQASGVIPHAGGFLLYDDTLNGIEGQLTISNPDSSGSSEDGVGISNTAAFGNQPGNVLGQFYQQQSGGDAETEPYHMLPPHPQSPWWVQQDQMYGQQVHNGQLPSQGGYAENSPEEFRANNHRQGGFQATRGNSANQWNANKDRRRSGDSENDERKEDADDDDHDNDDDDDDDDGDDDDDDDNDDDNDNETDYSAHKTWSRPAGRDGKRWGLSETEDNEKEVHETSMHSDSSTTEWDSRAWNVSAAVEHGEEVLNTTQSESSSDQTSTEEQSIPKPTTHQASTEESSSAKPTTEGISSVRPEPTSGRTQTSERSTHTAERAPRRSETQTSPTFTVRAGRYNTQNSTSSNRTNTGMTERDETQLSSTQSLTSTDTVSHETTVTLNTTEKHKAFMRNNTAGHRPSRSRSNHKAKRRRKQKASEAPEEQQTRGSKGRRRRRRKKRPQTQESGEDTSGRIQITTTAVELTTTNDVENGNETDVEKRSPHHNEVSGGSQHYSRNRVSGRPSSSEWGQNRFNEDRNSDNNNSTSEEDSDENDYDDKENHRDENGHEHANNDGRDHRRASSPRNGTAHGGNSGGRGHRTTARLPSPGRRVTTGLPTKGRMTTSSLPSTTVPSQTPPETSAMLPQTTTTVPSTDASPRTPTTPPTPSVSSPDSSPSGVPAAAHHSPPQGHRPERGRPHPGANHPEEHPPFNHSVIASRLLFAAVEQMVNEKCPEEPEDHVSSPRAWVDRVCSEVESTRSSGSLIVQRAVTSLEIKLLKALDKWNPERFLSHTAGVGDEDFVPRHKCFSVHALATNSATRLHSVNAENCHRDLHDFIARLSSAIVTNLLQGQRHGSDHEPCQFDFVSQLFFNFGDREAGCDYGHVMPVAGVQHLLDSIQKRNCSKGGQGQMRNQTHNLSAEPESVSRNNWSNNKHEHQQRSNDDAAKSKRNTWAVSENMYVYHKHSARELVNIVLKNESDSLTMPQFYQLCPSLLQQIWLTSHSDDFYLQEDHDHDHFDRAEVDDGVAASAIQTYGLGTAAVAVITVCSLLGAVMVRLCRGVGRHYAIACMMALAVGNLCGDAILHLIPEAFSLGHDHGSRDNHNDNHEDDSMYRLSGGFVVNDVRLKCLALLGSVYLFWLLEIFTSRYHECVQPGSGKKTVAKEPSVSTISGDYNGAQSIPMSSLAEMTEVTLSGQTRDRESTYEIITPQVLGQAKPVVTEIAEFKASSRHLVWMIVVGDAVHNLADGLAIGAAFAHSIPLGLSTSMAVVCHEIPHELGDFAVLMSTGMKMRKALLLNLLSALTAFVGLYIGLGIGAQLAHRQWIFIIVAGMFLYVSLADLVPELIRYFRHFRNFRMFILQSVGLLSGFALMFLLVLLEDVLHF